MKRVFKRADMTGGFNPSVNDCRCFLYLVTYGSLSRAARKAGMTQPALTYRLRSLERELGVVLWERCGRSGGRVTKSGELFVRYARVVVDETERLLRDVVSCSGGRRIIIAASTIPGEHLLPAVLEDFGRVCPGVDVKLSVTDSLEVHRMVSEDEAAIGFCGVAPPEESPLSAVPLVRDEIVLAAYPEWVSAHGEEISLSDLSGEVIIRREAGSGTWAVLEHAIRVNRLRFPKGIRFIEVGSTQAVVESIRRKAGIGFISRAALGDLGVVGVRELTPLNRFVFMVYIKGKDHDPVFREFVNVVLKHFSAY